MKIECTEEERKILLEGVKQDIAMIEDWMTSDIPEDDWNSFAKSLPVFKSLKDALEEWGKEKEVLESFKNALK